MPQPLSSSASGSHRSIVQVQGLTESAPADCWAPSRLREASALLSSHPRSRQKSCCGSERICAPTALQRVLSHRRGRCFLLREGGGDFWVPGAFKRSDTSLHGTNTPCLHPQNQEVSESSSERESENRPAPTRRKAQLDNQVTSDWGHSFLCRRALSQQLATTLVSQGHRSGQSPSPQQRGVDSHN